MRDTRTENHIWFIIVNVFCLKKIQTLDETSRMLFEGTSQMVVPSRPLIQRFSVIKEDRRQFYVNWALEANLMVVLVKDRREADNIFCGIIFLSSTQFVSTWART
jgi:hypothetical protein